MSRYYFLLLLSHCLIHSSYTVEDYFDHRNHLKRTKSMLFEGFTRNNTIRNFASKVFKEAIKDPNIKDKLWTFLEQCAMKLAYKNGADCNPIITYQDKSLGDESKEATLRHNLLSCLVFYHRIFECRLVCESKIKFLLEKCYIDINRQDAGQDPLVSFVFNQPTFDLLFSLGLDINQVDVQGRNFAIKINCAIFPYTGDETDYQLKLKQGFYQNTQYMTDYFSSKGGWLFRLDNDGNNVLHYIMWHGFKLLTNGRLKFLINKFNKLHRADDVKQKFLFSLINNHPLFYLTTFKSEFDLLTRYRKKLQELESEKKRLRDLKKFNNQESSAIENTKDLYAIEQLIKDLNKSLLNELKAREQRFALIKEYVEYLNTLFYYLLKNDFKIVDQSVSKNVIQHAIDISKNKPEKEFFNDSKTIDTLLYHFIINKDLVKGTIPENHFLFSAIIHEKLLEYSRSSLYKNVLNMYLKPKK